MNIISSILKRVNGLKTKIGVLGAFISSLFAGQPLLAEIWKDVATAPNVSNILTLAFGILAATGVIHSGYKIVKGEE